MKNKYLQGKSNPTALVLALLVLSLPILLIVVSQQQNTKQEAAGLTSVPNIAIPSIPPLPSLPPGCSSSGTSCSNSCVNGQCTQKCDRQVACVTGTPDQQVNQISNETDNTNVQQNCINSGTSCSTNCINGQCTKTCSNSQNCATTDSQNGNGQQTTQPNPTTVPDTQTNTQTQQNNVVIKNNCSSNSVVCTSSCNNGVCTNKCDQQLHCATTSTNDQTPQVPTIVTPPVHSSNQSVWDYITKLNAYWRKLVYPNSK